MNSCNRAHIIDLKEGYSLDLLGESSLAPTPKARSFELADDHVQYAPDRPADVKHVKLDITLDFEQETVSGTVYTTFSTLYDDLKTITFDAVELRIERVSLENGNELVFCTSSSQRRRTQRAPYKPGRLVSRVTTATGFPAMTHPTTVPRPKLSPPFLRNLSPSPTVTYSASPLMQLPKRIIGDTISPMPCTSFRL